MSGSFGSYLASAVFHTVLLVGLFMWTGPWVERFRIQGKRQAVSVEVIASDSGDQTTIEPTFEVASMIPIDVPDQVERPLPESVTTRIPMPEIAVSLSLKPSLVDGAENREAASESQTAGSDQEAAELSNNPPPAYPDEAIRRGLEGVVMLKLFINANGNVVFVEVVNSSGHPSLDEAAVQALMKWKGKPATRLGAPIPSEEYLPIRFRL